MQLLDVETAAKRLAMHPETLRDYLRRGEFEGIKIGRLWKIPEKEIEDYVKRLQAASKADADR